jgi:hypothetical protein
MKKLTLAILKRTMKELDLTMEDLQWGENAEKLISQLNHDDYISYWAHHSAYQASALEDSWTELRVYIQLDENNSGLYTFNNDFNCGEDYDELLDNLLYQEKRVQEILKITKNYNNKQ